MKIITKNQKELLWCAIMRCKICNVFTLLTIVMLPFIANAAPSITSTSETLAHGRSVTVTGSGFGSHANYNDGADTWQGATFLNRAWKDTEDGKLESDQFSVTAGLSSAFQVVTTNQRSNSTKSIRRYYNGSQLGALGVRANSNHSEWYGTWWVYYDESISTNTKVSRFWSNKSGNDVTIFLFGGTGNRYGGTDGLVTEWGGGTAVTKGSWHRFEIYMRAVSDTDKGVWVWNDGVLCWSHVNETGAWPPSVPYNDIGRTWDPIDYFDGPNGSSYWDDIYLDHTRARVEICSGSTWANRGICEVQIPTAWNDGSITVNINQGAFADNSSRYLYVVDSTGNASSSKQITFGTGGTTLPSPLPPPPSDTTAPTIFFSSPASGASLSGITTIAASASDSVGVAKVELIVDGAVAATDTTSPYSFTWDSTKVTNGSHTLSVKAYDVAGNVGTSTNVIVTVNNIVTAPAPTPDNQAWNAQVQTGDTVWKSSTVTYTVRLLVNGSAITKNAKRAKLAFKGRSTGDYAIRKVSIAEKDTSGLEGDVIDTTWTRVTFNGSTVDTWASDVITVPAGQEKLSDAISVLLQPGKDYYVTFKIDSPSVYLNPPSGYRELYFSSADHTDDVDWSSNGFSVSQDYHALSSIYVEVAAPTGVKGVIIPVK